MNVLVIGAAKSGIACSKLLSEKGYKVYLTDAQKIKESDELRAVGIIVYDEGHPDILRDIEWTFIVKNPGINYRVPFVKHFVEQGYKIYNEIELAMRFVDYQYGSITGTNGKTTTTAILEHLLKYQNQANTACGNIGLTLSEVVLKHPNEQLKIALEIAAFQLLGLETFRPMVSTCTNLSPDHLDYFDTLDEYYRTKMLVYANQRDDDWFIRNLDDDKIVECAKNIKCQIIDFSLNKKADLYLYDNKIYLFDEVLFDVSDLNMVGKHNVANAAMAACMAFKMGISISDIHAGIQTFGSVEHRIEYVDTIKGVKYYNDSKATNVEATIVALRAFDKPVILLAGGYDKKTGFNALIKETDYIKTLIAFGECKEQIKFIYPSTIMCDNIMEACAIAGNIAEKDDIVLLSPMCASYDQFANFEERGVYFKNIVAEMKED